MYCVSPFLRRYVLVVCRFPAPIHAKVWYFCKCTYLLQNCIYSICKQKCKWRGIIIKLVHKSNFSHFRSSNSNNFSELASIHQTFVSSSRRKKADTVTQFYYIWGDCCVRKKNVVKKRSVFFSGKKAPIWSYSKREKTVRLVHTFSDVLLQNVPKDFEEIWLQSINSNFAPSTQFFCTIYGRSRSP